MINLFKSPEEVPPIDTTEESITKRYDREVEEIIEQIKTLITGDDKGVEIDDKILKLNFEANKIIDRTSDRDLYQRKITSAINSL